MQTIITAEKIKVLHESTAQIHVELEGTSRESGETKRRSKKTRGGSGKRMDSAITAWCNFA